MKFITRSAALWLCVLATGVDTSARPPAEEPSGGSCTALAIFSEARGEPIDGQAMVAQVIFNRMRDPRYPATPCEVVNQLNQFQGVERWHFPRHPWVIDEPAWKLALRLAWDVPFGAFEPPGKCELAIEFRAEGAPAPDNLVALCTIGRHTFYGEP